MKFFYLKFVFTGFLLALFSLQSVSQRSNGIAIEGKISVQQGIVEGAYIQMFMDGRRMDNYGFGPDGRYKVELNYNHKFDLIFTANENFSQKIVVDATVPKEVLQSDPRFPPFPLDINLFTEIPGIDKSFTNNTILKIYYNQNVDNFVSELYYNDAQIAKLIEQAKLQGQQIGKESDFLSKLTRAELAEMRKEYNSLLSQADRQYSGEQFLAALDGYKAAGKIFPNEQFPKDRIAEINDLLGLMMVAAELDKALAERFDLLIKEAGQLMMHKNYTDARNSYNRALSIKPNDNFANQQVNLINDLLKKQMADEQYIIIIAQADNSFKQLLYNEASKSYQEALTVKPDESYPKTKLQEIKEILASEAKNAEKMESYTQAMQQGEIMFQKQFYEKSLASYENALSLKPGDEIAARKIEEIKGIMDRLADKLMYDKLIDSADKSYKKGLLNEALPDYVAAAAIIPDDKYATQRIEEINQKLQLAGNFTDLIAKADNEFNTKNYSEAKSLYQEALKIRATDKYSLDRVREIDVLLAVLGVEEKYNASIAQADELFNAGDYENAKGEYNEAATIKPKEKYPKDRILEINTILSQIAKTNQTYLQTIAKADGLMIQKSYEKAKEAFAEASRIKPEEAYPAEMIIKVDVLISEQSRFAAEAEAERIRLAQEAAAAETERLAAIQAEKDKNYSEAITKADNLENARNEYRTAQAVKPGEIYPQQRITEIGTLLAQLSAAQKAYETAIAKADKEFKAEKFDAAKLAYTEAQKAKPEESYPGEQIAKIDSTVETRVRLAAEAEAERIRLAQEAAAAETERLAAIQAEKDKNYSEAITKADNLFNEKQYENARNEYRAAQTVKPGETYPQQRITEIEKKLAALAQAKKEQELLERNYANAIQQADRFFSGKTYNQSKGKYNEALTLKPEESYPKERIAEIDRILEQQAIDERYRVIIVAADGFFKTESYLQAKSEYEKALTEKTEEQYPKNQIAKIDDILQKGQQRILSEKIAAEDLQRRTDEITKLNREIEARGVASDAELKSIYDQYIRQADESFGSKMYVVSRGWYYKAWDVKPDENYPKQRIDEINRLLNSLLTSQRDRDYQRFVDLADSTFRDNQYAVARGWYNRALGMKANEQYPKDQIKEIEIKIAERMAGQSGQLFEADMQKAAAAFEANNYNVARFWYKMALELRPDDVDAKNRLKEIDEALRK
ncbi:MAG: hypothetical protein FD181_1985 [Prolixibacteraceae bacterium]|nr:MAG: hypothetical protein FD181_1985 [Prolixibacteraceae bacterium]